MTAIPLSPTDLALAALLVLSTALFEKPAFKNVVVNGLLLAEDGSRSIQ